MFTVLISGYGDIGRRVARRWRQHGAEVIGLRRTPGSDPDATIIPVDMDEADAEWQLPYADIVYHFAAPPSQGETDPRLEKVLNQLAAAPAMPQKLILISTSAVYGDCAGAWVSEDSPVQPQSARGKRRWHAERIATQWCEQNQVTLVVLRVPGIYGPGRLPLARLRQALPVVEESASPYTNRIHSDDLAEICLQVAQQSEISGVYNASDGHPGNMTQYFNAVADACGIARPPQVTLAQAQQQLSAGMLSYLAESRRMDNRKLLRDTGIKLQYPDLETGLAQCIRQQ